MKEKTKPDFIYHLVTKAEFINQISESFYTPVRFSKDGFIHCTEKISTTLLVANDYFIGEKNVLILKLKLSKIKAEVIFEAPISYGNSGNSHLEANELFPHIYGSLNLNAIETIGFLEKENESYKLPVLFYTYRDFLKKEREWN